MATTETVKGVLWRVSGLLLDQGPTSPQFRRAKESNLVDYLNDGQLAIATYTNATARIYAVKFAVGTRQSIRTIAPADVLPSDGATPVYGMTVLDVIRDMGAAGTTPGNVIRRGNRKALDATVPSWHTKTAPVPSSWMFDPETPMDFYVAPGLVAPRFIEMRLTHQPKKVVVATPGQYLNSGSDTTLLSIGDKYVSALTSYIAARFNMGASENANSGDAAMYTASFLSEINAIGQAETGTNPNLKMLPFAPSPIARAAA